MTLLPEVWRKGLRGMPPNLNGALTRWYLALVLQVAEERLHVRPRISASQQSSQRPPFVRRNQPGEEPRREPTAQVHFHHVHAGLDLCLGAHDEIAGSAKPQTVRQTGAEPAGQNHKLAFEVGRLAVGFRFDSGRIAAEGDGLDLGAQVILRPQLPGVAGHGLVEGLTVQNEGLG